MNQKSVNIILIVLVIILAGVVGYLTLIKKPTPTATTNQIPSTNTSTQQAQTTTAPQPPLKPVNWESLIPAIRTVIGPTFLGVRVEESEPLSIFQKNDITGDGIPEALVNLGSGGAYTSYLTLMRIENNKPVIAQFKQKDGKISPLIFLYGASVMNSENVEMLPEKNAIYAFHLSRSNNENSSDILTKCTIEAYKWNSQTKNFDFSLSLTKELEASPGFCPE